MSDVAVEVDHVWKKFHRGEFHDSLRDAIPALVKRFLGRGPNRQDLGEGDFWALRGVGFQVRCGEVLGIIGANGAGKSTLLKILARILKPNRGCIHVRGRLRALIEIAAGFHGDLTGRENIYLNGCILGMKKREIDAKFDQIVDFSGIEPFLDTPVKRYSSGMYARLGFAVAAHLDPEILIVDEVLAVGDAQFQKKSLGKMSEVGRSGRTVVFVSHNMTAVAELCTRCILLDQGCMAADGHPGEVIESYLSASGRSEAVALAERSDRSGTGAVRIIGCRVSRSAQGEPAGDFFLGDPLHIEMTLESARSAAVFVGVRLADRLGRNVFSFFSREAAFQPRLEPGENRVTLHIPWLPLLEGEYVLSGHVTDAEDFRRADDIDHMADISLHPRDVWDTGASFKARHGVVFIPHVWSDPHGNSSGLEIPRPAATPPGSKDTDREGN